MQALFDLLGRFSQPLLIVGGHALAAHGVARQTVDVDCLVAVENRKTFDAHLCGGGFVRLSETDNFARYSHPSDLVPDVDVLFVDASTFDKLNANGVPLQRGSVKLQAPALPHLIALKLHAIRNNPAREAGDLGDIARLLRANPDVVSQSELAMLCAQFGSLEVAAKLQSLQTAP
jgi:predicted nucleotidyltransferase